MNERFVCVKVDREERPDVDALYMDAVQAMTGHGGWPLNVFLTPEQAAVLRRDLLPAGAAPRACRAGARCWTRSPRPGTRSARRSARRASAVRAAAGRRRAADGRPRSRSSAPSLDDAVATLRAGLRRASTAASGGAPKFPQASVDRVPAARAASAPMALQTLRSMAGGGIYDQVGGGFARYSVDARWTVPHFEKMLYDNALLARAYLHGFQASGDALLRRTAEETLDWALREMRAPEGGFYSRAGRRLRGRRGQVLRLDASTSCARRWATTPTRRSPGSARPSAATSRAPTSSSRAAPSRPPSSASGSARRCSASARARVRPGLDDKRLTAWNALMIAALADAGRRARPRATTSTPRARAPSSCSRDLRDARRPPAAHLQRRHRRKLGAYLEDHAFLLEALLALYEATFEERWFVEAARAGRHDRSRASPTPSAAASSRPPTDHEPLIARRKDLEDTPIPSGGSSAALGLLRLRRAHRRGRLRGAGRGPARAAARDRGPATRPRSGTCCRRSTSASPPRREVALAGDPAGVAALAAVVRERAGRTSSSRPGRARADRGARSCSARARRRPRGGLRVRALRLPHAESPRPDELRALLRDQ